MYRVASRVPRRAVLAASATAAGVLLTESNDKLSIYPAPTPDVLLVESPSPLEEQIGVARRKVQNTYADGHAYVQGWVSRWIGIEHAVEHRIKAIIAPDESLTPGLLYVGVATLTGSIISRNRFLLTRLLLPPLFLVVSAQHFLPHTTSNLSQYFGSLEDAHFPALSQKHDIAKAHSQMTWERIKEATSNTREQLNKGILTSVEKIQQNTGLKIKETLGWTESIVKKAEDKALQIAHTTEKKVEEKVAEIVHAAEKKVKEINHSAQRVEEVKPVEPTPVASPSVEEKPKEEEVKRLV